MKYRRLGRTDLTVSVVGLGTWQFGGEWGKDYSQNEADAIVGSARDAGINLIDTAECYGDHVSESLVGKAITRDRDDWVVATKFGHRYLDWGTRRAEWSPSEVVAQLERSLRALATDHVDLYQFHSGDDEVFDNDDLWDVLQQQVQAGKVRHLGVSIGSNTNIHQTRRAAELGASAIQLVYSRIDREPEDEVLPACADLDLGVLTRESLAGGLLSGKYQPGTTFTDPRDTRSERDPGLLARRLEEVARIRESEVPADTDMASWAVAWCLRDSAVTSVLAGCKSVEQVQSNASAADRAEVAGPTAL